MSNIFSFFGQKISRKFSKVHPKLCYGGKIDIFQLSVFHSRPQWLESTRSVVLFSADVIRYDNNDAGVRYATVHRGIYPRTSVWIRLSGKGGDDYEVIEVVEDLAMLGSSL